MSLTAVVILGIFVIDAIVLVLVFSKRKRSQR